MKKRLLFVIYLFFFYLFLFYPQFRGIPVLLSPYILIALLSFFLIFSNISSLKQNYRLFKKEILLLLLLCFFTEFRVLLNGEYDISTLIYTYYWIIVIPLFIFYLNKINVKTDQQIFSIILVVGAIASLISSFCVISPSFNSYVKEQLLVEDEFLSMNNYRGFGIAYRLTSSYGFILGVILGMSILLYNKFKWFFLFIPFMLLSIILNARTGIIISLASLLVFFFYTKRKIYFIIIISFLFIFLLYFLVDIVFLLGLEEKSVMFIVEFLDEIIGTYESGNISNSTAGTLMGEMWIMPSSIIEWLVGSGIYLFSMHKSDVGWVNQLNFGGILYLTLIIVLFYIMLRRLVRIGYKPLALFLFIALVIINTKGILYPSIMELNLFFFLYYSIVRYKLLYYQKPC